MQTDNYIYFFLNIQYKSAIQEYMFYHNVQYKCNTLQSKASTSFFADKLLIHATEITFSCSKQRSVSYLKNIIPAAFLLLLSVVSVCAMFTIIMFVLKFLWSRGNSWIYYFTPVSHFCNFLGYYSIVNCFMSIFSP